ncbi:GPW/gp25 family protein [Aliikangiella coralliicola]|uniref:GPW/gp25 family protein n=1 Tax=Aliikangiella coralliicola TaxID=2592383 RepID=A0A545UE70_9GAMM|nr:GPW/gp25 family protein [Aliikangiella coralliicola]TQV87761.1 GPW/gp25 family protein [Aliikangiella coralliicola]
MSEEFISMAYPFAINQGQGQLAQERDYDAHVKQLILQVLFTAPGERINRPEFGCGVKRLVFSPGGEVAATLAQTTIFQALDRWLNNVIKVKEVTVQAVEASLEIRIGYMVIARGTNQYLNLTVAG